MNKILIIVRHEYLSRIKSKGFILGTILGPILMLALIFLPALFSVMSVGNNRQIAIFDETGRFGTQLVQENTPSSQPIDLKNAEEMAGDLEKQASLEKTTLVLSGEGLSREQFERQYQDSIRSGKWFGYLIISGDSLSLPQVTFTGSATSDFVAFSAIERRISQLHRIDLLTRIGLPRETALKINESVRMKVYKLSESGTTEDSGFSFILAFSMGFIIYMSMFIYGSMVMQSAMEEKQTRIMEVIISSIRPDQLLMGKIIGIGALALTQYIIWAVTAGLLAVYGSLLIAPFTGGTDFFNFNIPIFSLVAFVFYFIAGFLIFATFYASVGASVDNITDATQITSPIALVIIIPIMLISLVVREPGSTFSIIMSLIPFFSPILMVARIAIETPPAWQLITSVILMVLTFLVMVKAAGKIYRVGVLMYGKRITLKELGRWLRY